MNPENTIMGQFWDCPAYHIAVCEKNDLVVHHTRFWSYFQK